MISWTIRAPSRSRRGSLYRRPVAVSSRRAIKWLVSGALLLVAAAQLSSSQTPPPAAQTPAANTATPRPPPRRGGGGGGRLYPAADAETVDRGKKQFLSTCAFCHGSNAKGGESGPDLLRSVLVLDDEHGDQIGPVILNGRPDKGMPKFTLSHEQISDISAFLLDRVKAAALRGTYQILNIVTGDPKAGEAYFNGAGQCSSCHSLTGDLAHVGSKYDPVTLQQKFVMPEARGGFMQPAAPSQKPVTVKVTPASGDAVQGRLERIDDFTVSLTTAEGDYRSFTRKGDVPKVEIHNPTQAHLDLLFKYKDSDIHNLTAYLVTVK